VLAPERPLRFIHPIVRNAILSELGIGQASLLQRRSGQLLLESDAAPESVAAHLQQTEPIGEAWVVSALRDGARAALAGGAPAAAAGYLERALAEPAPVALHRFPLRCQWDFQLMSVDRPTRLSVPGSSWLAR